MPPSWLSVVLLLAASLGTVPESRGQTNRADRILVDDFEGYDDAGIQPHHWHYLNPDKRDLEPVPRALERDRDYFEIIKEDGNTFVRVVTKNEITRVVKANEKDFSWTLDAHPRLQWKWRARQLPSGASEKDQNDTGGALYVTFDDKDWLGRPKSIKYTYSSSLPVGTTVSFGNLKVIVASSAQDGYGQWKTVTRNVAADYRRVFGGDPPQPVAIALWSDTDTTELEAEVDFDDIVLLPPDDN